MVARLLLDMVQQTAHSERFVARRLIQRDYIRPDTAVDCQDTVGGRTGEPRLGRGSRIEQQAAVLPLDPGLMAVPEEDDVCVGNSPSGLGRGAPAHMPVDEHKPPAFDVQPDQRREAFTHLRRVVVSVDGGQRRHGLELTGDLDLGEVTEVRDEVGVLRRLEDRKRQASSPAA